MKPKDGRYTLTGPAPDNLTAEALIQGGMLTLSFGTLTYDPEHDWFRDPETDVTIRFYEGTLGLMFTAVWGPQSYSGTVT